MRDLERAGGLSKRDGVVSFRRNVWVLMSRERSWQLRGWMPEEESYLAFERRRERLELGLRRREHAADLVLDSHASGQVPSVPEETRLDCMGRQSSPVELQRAEAEAVQLCRPTGNAGQVDPLSRKKRAADDSGSCRAKGGLLFEEPWSKSRGRRVVRPRAGEA